MITARKLPHSKVALGAVKDRATREAVMKLNENIAALGEQLAELQAAHIAVERDLGAAKAKITALETA